VNVDYDMFDLEPSCEIRARAVASAGAIDAARTAARPSGPPSDSFDIDLVDGVTVVVGDGAAAGDGGGDACRVSRTLRRRTRVCETVAREERKREIL
jgi:hypothetical protein